MSVGDLSNERRTGPSRRSVHRAAQRVARLQSPVVTTIEMNRPFYGAEGYHQDFLTRNPTHPYIVINDLPKISDLKRLFPDVYRTTPVLVGRTR
ncbi:MAG TPA: peptide-methionine (S)-S-oxide reductase [Vicinamibacterales bacterium]|nr:peptide-methionine (S)-S-oxide reductase [Vicinamibacterales bacterium]